MFGGLPVGGPFVGVMTLSGPSDIRDGMIAHWPMDESTATANAVDVHGTHDLYMVGTGQAAQNPIDATPARDFEADSANYMTFSPPGPLTVTGAHIASTLTLWGSTLVPGAVSVTTGTVASTLQVRVPTVAPGVVTVGGVHRATTLTLFAASIAVGPVTVVGVHRATTIQVNAPTVTPFVSGATVVSGNQRFAPTVAQAVTTATRPTTIQVFAPSTAAGVTTATIASALFVRVPSVTTGPVSVTTAFRAATTVLYEVTVAAQVADTVGTVNIASTAVLSSPIIIPLTGGDFNVANGQPWTMIVRCKFETAPSAMGLGMKVMSGVSGTIAWGLYWGPTYGFATIVTGSGGGELVRAGTAPAYTAPVIGTTYVIAGGYDPSTQQAWVRVNADARIYVAVPFVTADAVDLFLVGAIWNTSSPTWNFDGGVGPVSFWKQVLPDEDVDYWISVKGDYALIGGA